jgi:hypothetical protein
MRGGNDASKRAVIFLFVAVLLLALAVPARAQKNSNYGTVNLQANKFESLSVTAAPALVNFNLVAAGGVAPGSAPITVTTTWVLFPFRTATTYAYFVSSAAALTDGAGNNITSSQVQGSVNGGAYTAFTGASPFSPSGSVQIYSTFIFFNIWGSHTDTLNLQINTTGVKLPAGIYSGLLVIQAQAI